MAAPVERNMKFQKSWTTHNQPRQTQPHSIQNFSVNPLQHDIPRQQDVQQRNLRFPPPGKNYEYDNRIQQFDNETHIHNQNIFHSETHQETEDIGFSRNTNAYNQDIEPDPHPVKFHQNPPFFPNMPTLATVSGDGSGQRMTLKQGHQVNHQPPIGHVAIAPTEIIQPDILDSFAINHRTVQKQMTDAINIDQQAPDDKRWLENWLHQRSKESESKTTKITMKMCEAQDKTRDMMVLLARLQKNKQILETVQHEDRSIWEQKLKEVLAIKTQLECLQKEVSSEDTVKQLLSKVQRRKKQRTRVRVHAEQLYRQCEAEMASTERRNTQIDKTMQHITEKQKLEKQEGDMQKEADDVLCQVRKKLAEANKSIQVVKSLQKLRKLRTDRLERQGILSMYATRGHSSTNTLLFEARLSNVTDLLNKQLDVYRDEEAALKIHLETEQEETREKEREKARLRMIERQKQERRKEEKMIFGSQKEPVPGDPLYTFTQYYDAGSHSLDALIAIRREWDGYLTRPDLGTSIPDSWVLPTEPVTDVWATALRNRVPT